MRILKADTPALQQAFLDLPRSLYSDDPNWVGPLDHELRALFSPKHNPHFSEGEAQWWVLQNAQGRTLGRIAAFVYYPKARRYAVPTGSIGFFECVQDYGAAEALLSTAEAWLAERKLEAADACVNFGENDRFWGVLVEALTRPPLTACPTISPTMPTF